MTGKIVTWQDLPLVLTTEDVAEVLQLHPNTVKRMAITGQLRAVKVGKGWRYNRADVMAFMGLAEPGPQHLPRLTAEDLYKIACYRHWRAQQPDEFPGYRSELTYWHGCAAGLAWLLKSRGLTDAQLAQMEQDGIECGKADRWAGIIEALDRPDGTVPHND